MTQPRERTNPPKPTPLSKAEAAEIEAKYVELHGMLAAYAARLRERDAQDPPAMKS